MSKRNVNLDLIKCIACLGVVGLHGAGMRNYTIYYLCSCGVPFFFMVNGYLMFSKKEISHSYALHKIIQLIKIVFCWNLLIAIPVFIFRQKLVNPFTQSLNSLMQEGYLWHFWFFGALMLLYAFLPLLHRLLKDRLVLHVICCAGLMGICLYMSFSSMAKGYPVQMFIPQTFRLWTWLFYFLAGGLINRIIPLCNRFPLVLHCILVLSVTIINDKSAKYVGLYMINNRQAEFFYDNVISMVWYLLSFLFLMRIPISEKADLFISRLCELTMGIFIIHPVLLTALSKAALPAGLFITLAFWFGLTLISGIGTFIMLKIPVVKELVKL